MKYIYPICSEVCRLKDLLFLLLCTTLLWPSSGPLFWCPSPYMVPHLLLFLNSRTFFLLYISCWCHFSILWPCQIFELPLSISCITRIIVQVVCHILGLVLLGLISIPHCWFVFSFIGPPPQPYHQFHGHNPSWLMRLALISIFLTGGFISFDRSSIW